ncbi:GntR family transcriptional regulator [Saccharopolyspora sp. NPDC000995]
MRSNSDPSSHRTALPTVQTLTARILEDIRSGRLPTSSAFHPGELARRHDASLTAVRVALLALGHEGIVVSAPRKGYVLPAVEPREVLDLFVLRRALEGAAAVEAAARLNGGAISGLLADGRADDPLCLNGIHLRLVRSCSSARLVTLLDATSRAASRLEGAGLADPQPRQTAVEHRLILQAVLRGDATAAGHHMQEHIDQVRIRATQHWLNGGSRRAP